jgi:Acetoacetate decarboxylase (ADC)
MASQRSIPSRDPTVDLRRFGRAYLRFGTEFWTRSLKITASYARLAADRITSSQESLSPRELLDSYLLALESYLIEMITTVPLALESLGTRDLDEASASKPTKMILVGGKPVLFPVRIAEASQGWALYFVAAERAQNQLKKHETDLMEIVDVGGRTPVLVFGIDHRQSDLGKYQEIGVALFVRPHHGPSEVPGMFFLSLVVNDQFTIDASRTAWGYQKRLARNMTVRYGANSTTFCFDDRDPTAFSVSFPQFGRNRSTDIPVYIYSIFYGAGNGNAALQRTMLSRSSVAEGAQVGGAVQVQLGKADPNKCACLGNGVRDSACVCSILQELQLPQTPAANGWANLVSGSFGTPLACT